MPNIIGILADRERGSRVLKNSDIILDDVLPQVDLWEGVIEEAKQMGFEVEFAGNYINFRRGRSHGEFTNSGGTMLAREFLSA